MNRREFFRRVSGVKPAMLPPGAMPQGAFGERCNSCGDCVSACPQNIIKMPVGKLPSVSFSNAGCTFCGDCASACERGAIKQADNLETTWNWRAQISQSCLDKNGTVCRACEFYCDERAIRFKPVIGGRHDVTVLQEACNGCGDCISACPSKSIGMYVPQLQTSKLEEAVA